MKIIRKLIFVILAAFVCTAQAFAFRVPAASWYSTLTWPFIDGYYYRMYNSNAAYDMFIPGRDDAGVTNLTNWNAITWSKQRPGIIRIHLALWPAADGIHNCPGASVDDPAINYWGTSNGNQGVTSSTTVLATSDYLNRLPNTWVQGYDGELRCDFGALY